MKKLQQLIIAGTLVLITACSATPKQSLYDEIGGRETLDHAMRLAVNRIYNDAQIGHFFKGVPKRHIHKELTDQFCNLIGGPCEYTGKTMVESHKDLNITDSDFYILVEYVQGAMRDVGITYEQENRILRYIAPLKSEIVYL
ncbi:group 1 truncated hemoglobin [Alteromonadaceae bacterium M269]|nr:group 1 truncated hemoglobin [Alteromonadaceae bacterium M269]